MNDPSISKGDRSDCGSTDQFFRELAADLHEMAQQARRADRRPGSVWVKPQDDGKATVAVLDGTDSELVIAPVLRHRPADGRYFELEPDATGFSHTLYLLNKRQTVPRAYLNDYVLLARVHAPERLLDVLRWGIASRPMDEAKEASLSLERLVRFAVEQGFDWLVKRLSEVRESLVSPLPFNEALGLALPLGGHAGVQILEMDFWKGIPESRDAEVRCSLEGELNLDVVPIAEGPSAVLSTRVAASAQEPVRLLDGDQMRPGLSYYWVLSDSNGKTECGVFWQVEREEADRLETALTEDVFLAYMHALLGRYYHPVAISLYERMQSEFRESIRWRLLLSHLVLMEDAIGKGIDELTESLPAGDLWADLPIELHRKYRDFRAFVRQICR